MTGYVQGVFAHGKTKYRLPEPCLDSIDVVERKISIAEEEDNDD